MGFLERFYSAQVPEWSGAYVRLKDYLALLEKLSTLPIVTHIGKHRHDPRTAHAKHNQIRTTTPRSISGARPSITGSGSGEGSGGTPASHAATATPNMDESRYLTPLVSHPGEPLRFTDSRRGSIASVDLSVGEDFRRALERIEGDSLALSRFDGSDHHGAELYHSHEHAAIDIHDHEHGHDHHASAGLADPFLLEHAHSSSALKFGELFVQLLDNSPEARKLFSSSEAERPSVVMTDTSIPHPHADYGSMNEMNISSSNTPSQFAFWVRVIERVSPYFVGTSSCRDLARAIRFLSESAKRRVTFLERYATHPISHIFLEHAYECKIAALSDSIAQVVCPGCGFKQLIKPENLSQSLDGSAIPSHRPKSQSAVCVSCQLNFTLALDSHAPAGAEASIDYESLLVIFQLSFLADVCRVHAFHSNTEKLLHNELARLDKLIIRKQKQRREFEMHARRASLAAQGQLPTQPISLLESGDESVYGEPPSKGELENIFKELYRGGEMLRSYDQLNVGAFVKLLDYLQRHLQSRAKRVPEALLTLHTLPKVRFSHSGSATLPNECSRRVTNTQDEMTHLLSAGELSTVEDVAPSARRNGRERRGSSPILAAAAAVGSAISGLMSFKDTISLEGDKTDVSDMQLIETEMHEPNRGTIIDPARIKRLNVSELREELSDTADSVVTELEKHYSFAAPDDSSMCAERLLHTLRQRYTSVFGGSERDAHQALRVRLEESSELILYEIGCLMGVSLCLLLTTVLFALVVPDFMLNYSYLVASAPLFRVLFAVTLVLYCWGAVLYACEYYGVNFVFILNADVRSALSHLKVWYCASVLSFISLGTLVTCGVLYLRIWLGHEMALLANETESEPRPPTPTPPTKADVAPSFETMAPHFMLTPSFVQLVVFLGLLLVIFCPFKLFFYHTRKYLGNTLMYALASPFSNPTFEVAFLTDHLCSLTKVAFDLTYSICFYSADIAAFFSWNEQVYSTCKPMTSEAQKVLVFIPFLLRLLQCVKRYLTHGKDFRQLINAGKYGTSILMTALAIHYKNTLSSLSPDALDALAIIPTFGPVHFHALGDVSASSTRAPPPPNAIGILASDTTFPVYLTPDILHASRARSGYVAVAVVATMYQFLWDLRMDWGLLELGSAFPFRARSVFGKHRNLIYTIAAIINLILRCAWVDTLLPASLGFPGAQLRSEMWIFVIISLEIVRHAIWSFFRLENEHLNNVGEYRALKIATPAAPSLILTENELDSIPLQRNQRSEPFPSSFAATKQPFDTFKTASLQSETEKDTSHEKGAILSEWGTSLQTPQQRSLSFGGLSRTPTGVTCTPTGVTGTPAAVTRTPTSTLGLPQQANVSFSVLSTPGETTAPSAQRSELSASASRSDAQASLSPRKRSIVDAPISNPDSDLSNLLLPPLSRGPSRLLRMAGRNLLLESVDQVVATSLQVEKARQKFMGLLRQSRARALASPPSHALSPGITQAEWSLGPSATAAADEQKEAIEFEQTEQTQSIV